MEHGTSRRKLGSRPPRLYLLGSSRGVSGVVLAKGKPLRVKGQVRSRAKQV